MSGPDRSAGGPAPPGHRRRALRTIMPPGHGDPFTGDLRTITARARQAGIR
ncbi:hypothetical protein [Streptomyces sp. NPDC055109]